MTCARKAVSGQIVFTVLDRSAVKNRTCDTKPAFLKSSVTHSQYSYPLKLMVPDTLSTCPCQWVYVICYGGGLVQGDDIALSVQVNPFSAVLVTTQSATKVYDCEPGIQTSQNYTYSVAERGLLAILPDPLMCFEKAEYKQTQTVDMSASGNLLLLNWVSGGRIARGECWDFTSLESRDVIRVNGSVVVRDGLLLRDTGLLTVKQAMKKHTVFGSLYILGEELCEFTKLVSSKVGERKTYDSSHDPSQIVSVSPLHFQSSHLTGCVLRFSMTSTKQAYDFLQDLFKPLFPLLGGNPFLNK